MTNSQSKQNASNKTQKESKSFDISLGTLNVRGLRDDFKRKLVLDWLKTLNIDVICLQETYCTKEFKTKFNKNWDGEVYHSESDSKNSKGVCILFKKGLDIKVLDTHKDEQGRRLIISVKINNETFTFVNIYAPSDNPENRIAFYKRCSSWIKQLLYSENQLVVTGDFNSVLSSKGRASGKTDRSTKHFQGLLKYLSLKDAWGTLKPNDPGFTYVNPGKPDQQSRLDYVLLSPILCNLTKKISIKVAPVPDHKMVITHIVGLNRKRGPSYWKLNVSILKDKEYKEGIKRVVINTKKEYSALLSKTVLLDLAKAKAKEFSIWFSCQKAKQMRNEIQSIENELQDIDSNICLNTEDAENLSIDRILLKTKLDELYEKKARGAMIRSRAKWVEEGEKCTKFFISLEQKHQTFNRIDKLQTSDGNLVENDREILGTTRLFYTDLYSTTNPDIAEINKYVQDTPVPYKLSDDEKDICEGLVTKEECLEALKK